MATSTSLSVTDAQMIDAQKTLAEFVAIPSISDTTNQEYDSAKLDEAAYFVKKQFEALDFTTREVRIKDSPLYVIAERIHDTSLPTILLYAHYDVQPVDRANWREDLDPFTLKQEDDRIYGRGASDDKAGIIAITTALKVLKEANQTTKYNIKIISEGEEEFGSAHMEAFLKQEAKNLQADAMIILDGMNKDTETGTVNNSLRGILQLAMRINALNQPVHSGIGGLAPDPAMEMSVLVASLSNPREITGFMDECTPLSQKEISLIDAQSIDSQNYTKELGVINGQLRGDPKRSIYRRIVDEPSITITNIVSGETGGPGVVQDKAECTISVRLTPGQTPEHVEKCIRNHLDQQSTPGKISFTLTRQVGALAWKSDATQPYTQLFLKAMEQAYPKAGLMPCGGAIPLLGQFDQAFPNMEKIVAGVEDPDTNAHSHNESQSKKVLTRTVNSLINFFKAAKES